MLLPPPRLPHPHSRTSPSFSRLQLVRNNFVSLSPAFPLVCASFRPRVSVLVYTQEDRAGPCCFPAILAAPSNQTPFHPLGPSFRDPRERSEMDRNECGKRYERDEVSTRSAFIHTKHSAKRRVHRQQHLSATSRIIPIAALFPLSPISSSHSIVLLRMDSGSITSPRRYIPPRRFHPTNHPLPRPQEPPFSPTFPVTPFTLHPDHFARHYCRSTPCFSPRTPRPPPYFSCFAAASP